MQKTLQELAQIIQGTLIGNGSISISGITGLEQLKSGHLTYVLDAKQLKEVENSPVAAVIVSNEIKSSSKPLIQSNNPKLAWAVLLGLYHPAPSFSKQVSNQASVAKTAQLGKHVTVEPFAFIGENVKIADGSVIRSFSYIDQNCTIGSNTIIHAHAVLYFNTEVGNKVIIHAGAIIGSDGFGYVSDGKTLEKIPQVGNVKIEDSVEIGACVTIDRATIGSTVIRFGVKIDNLVQIAHNVEVGEHTALSAQVGISGSSKIGKNVTMGGRVGLGDHCDVGDGATLGAQAGLPSGKSIPPKQTWIGAPARPYEEMRKQVGAQLRSYETLQLVNELKKRIEALEKELNDLKAKP